MAGGTFDTMFTWSGVRGRFENPGGAEPGAADLGETGVGIVDPMLTKLGVAAYGTAGVADE